MESLTRIAHALFPLAHAFGGGTSSEDAKNETPAKNNGSEDGGHHSF